MKKTMTILAIFMLVGVIGVIGNKYVDNHFENVTITGFLNITNDLILGDEGGSLVMTQYGRSTDYSFNFSDDADDLYIYDANLTIDQQQNCGFLGTDTNGKVECSTGGIVEGDVDATGHINATDWMYTTKMCFNPGSGCTHNISNNCTYYPNGATDCAV